ncbi:MAG: MFS transporter [Novosphingobium sp.]
MARAAAFSGWRMVAICFFIMNCTLGANFAAYGALVEAIQREYGTSRALASMGISMVTLALGLLAPLVGGLLRKVSIRTVILTGLALNGGGYLLLTQATGIGAFLAIYGLLIGPGFALAGVVPCTAIVSNWFAEGRGRAIGLINIPLGNALLPLAAAALMAHFGLSGALAGNGLLLLALFPLAWFLVDTPERIGQAPLGRVATAAVPVGEPPLRAIEILRLPQFAVLTLGVALLSAAGLVMVAHLVPLALDRGIPLAQASLLLSVFGLAGLIGAPLFGWLADRIGAGRSMAALSLAWIAPWLALLVAGDSLPLLLALAFVIGLLSNGILTLFGVLAGEWLGDANVPLGMGLCYLFKIPFLFAAAPLAGAMFDRSGSYAPTILLHVTSFALIGAVFLIYRPRAVATEPGTLEPA